MTLHHALRASLLGGGATVVYTDFQVDTANLTSYSFTCNIGAADTARVVSATIFGSRGSGTPASISTVTINGVSATVRSSITTDAFIVAIYTAVVPTGTTGVTVAVTFGQSQNRAAVAVHAMYGLQNAGVVTAQTTSTTITTLAGSLNIAAGGVAIGGALASVATAAFTWTGLTEDADQILEAATGVSAASAASKNAVTPLSVGAAYTPAASFRCAAFATFR